MDTTNFRGNCQDELCMNAIYTIPRTKDKRLNTKDQYEITFGKKEQAERLLDGMSRSLRTSSIVTVHDALDMAGIVQFKGDETNYGWTSIENSEIKEIAVDTWILFLPPPQEISQMPEGLVASEVFTEYVIVVSKNGHPIYSTKTGPTDDIAALQRCRDAIQQDVLKDLGAAFHKGRPANFDENIDEVYHTYNRVYLVKAVGVAPAAD